MHELWIELLDILRDNADLRKNNLILHHERQQEVSQREEEFRDRMQDDEGPGPGAAAGGGAVGGGRGGGGGGGGGGDGGGGSGGDLTRASTAPGGSVYGRRPSLAPREYGEGMHGYVKRCYAECEGRGMDHSA